jgi:hypothetical protein
MALPLIPFAAGVALGSLVTYGATDKALHRRVAELATAAAGRIRAGTDKVVDTLPKLGRKARVQAEGVVEAVQEGAEEVSDKAKAVVDEAVSKAKRSASKAGSDAQKAIDS